MKVDDLTMKVDDHIIGWSTLNESQPTKMSLFSLIFDNTCPVGLAHF